MDNLGDWIYIVFLVIAAASGLFGSKNKKKRPTEVLGQPGHDTYPEEKTTGKGFWEILEEMQEEPPKQPVDPPPTVVTVKKKKTEKKGQASSPFLSTEKQIPNSITATSPITQFPIEEESSVLSEMDFTDATDLRKAVIYSEILNRKY